MMDLQASYAVAPSAHFAWIGHDLVALDLARDASYSCWADAAAYVSDIGCGRVMISDADVAATLMDYGLIVRGEPAPGARPPAPAAPKVAHHGAPAPRGSTVERLQFSSCVARMAIDYHGRRIGQIVRMAQREALPLPSNMDEVVRRTALFAAWMPWAPFQGVCLYRCFLLLRFLRAAGLSATWVFGVRTWPFNAHCWLQLGPHLLDDDLDHVGAYTPILAL